MSGGAKWLEQEIREERCCLYVRQSYLNDLESRENGGDVGECRGSRGERRRMAEYDSKS